MVGALVLMLISASADKAMSADLVIIGDSISAPSDAGAWTIGQGYGALIASRTGMTEVNYAASGATVVPTAGAPSDMQAQWTSALARSPKPAGIIMMAGSNDTYWQTDVATFQSKIDGWVSSALTAGIPVTLVTTFPRQIPSSWFQHVMPYVQVIRAVGAARNVVVVDAFAWFAQLSLTDSNYAAYTYTGDSINAHPTAAGQLQIASLFSMPQYANAVGYSPPTPPPSVTIWNASDKSAAVSISGDGLTASTSAADVGIRSTSGKSSGKWFAKFQQAAGGNKTLVGVARGAAALDYPGADANGWGLFSANGKKITNNVQTAYGSTFGDGSTVYIAVDMDAGKVWFGNSSGWFGSGNPATGANPAFTGLTGTVFLMFGTANPGTSAMTLNTSDPTGMPSGFSLWAP